MLKLLYTKKGLIVIRIFTLIVCLLSANIHALSKKHVDRLKLKKDITYSDLKHENPHCPENSICSVSNGKKIKFWNKKIEGKNIKDTTLRAERLRNEIGLPVLFLTTKTSDKAIDPIIWNSRCRDHNPKDKTQTVFKALKFFRNDPKSEHVNLVTINTKKRKKNISYKIPYEAQPLLIWKKKIFFVHEFDDVLFHMSISSKGIWRAEYIPEKILSKARFERENTKCILTQKANKFYSASYCTNVWNADTKKLETLEHSWSCP
jgi:hypothetical protein